MAYKATTRSVAILVLLGSLCLLLAGCGGPPSVDGEWSGSVQGANGEAGVVVLELQQEGDAITGGTGELREDEASGGQGVSLSIEGGSVSDDGQVAMNAVSDGAQPVRLTGTVSGDTLELTLVTQGGDELPMTLKRQG